MPVSTIRCTPRGIRPRLGRFLRQTALLLMVLSTATCSSLAAETNAPPSVTGSIGDTNSPALLNACLQLQEQLRATQLAIEQNGREIQETAARNAEALSNALQSIQETFALQRARDLAAVERSNKLMLMVASTFAALGFLTLLMMSYLQWRLSKGLAEISAAVPEALGWVAGSAAGTLGPAGPASLRLAGITQPQQRRVPDPPQGAPPAARPSETANRGPDLKLFHDPVTSLRRGRIRPLRTAVIVGVICAAALALMFYVVAYRKLGFGHLLDVFRSLGV
jgi:hypothetical protein